MTDLAKRTPFAGLVAAKQALLNLGFCSPSDVGTGDPEVNAIDAAIATLKPFAKLIGTIDDQPSEPDDADWFRHDGYVITYGDIRRASALFHGECADKEKAK